MGSQWIIGQILNEYLTPLYVPVLDGLTWGSLTEFGVTGFKLEYVC